MVGSSGRVAGMKVANATQVLAAEAGESWPMTMTQLHPDLPMVSTRDCEGFVDEEVANLPAQIGSHCSVSAVQQHCQGVIPQARPSQYHAADCNEGKRHESSSINVVMVMTGRFSMACIVGLYHRRFRSIIGITLRRSGIARFVIGASRNQRRMVRISMDGPALPAWGGGGCSSVLVLLGGQISYGVLSASGIPRRR